MRCHQHDPLAALEGAGDELRVLESDPRLELGGIHAMAMGHLCREFAEVTVEALQDRLATRLVELREAALEVARDELLLHAQQAQHAHDQAGQQVEQGQRKQREEAKHDRDGCDGAGVESRAPDPRIGHGGH